MRICILIERYYPHVGGTEKQARNLALGLKDLGAEVMVVTRRSSPEMPPFSVEDGVPVYRAPMPGRSTRLRWILALTCIPKLVALRDKYDILFVSSFRTLGLPVLLTGKLLGKRVILKADSPGELSGECFTPGMDNLGLGALSPVVGFLIRLRNHFLRKADAFVGMSSEAEAEFMRCGVRREAISIIPNIVDQRVFHPAKSIEKANLRKKLGLPLDVMLVTYTGRLVSYKGLPMLLKAWKDLTCRQMETALVLVGSGGEDIANCEKELRDFVDHNGMSGVVTFAGNVDNVQEYLQASDVFVFPTQYEAFGLSLIEAMACGLPAVASAAGGVKDIIESGRNGLLVDPKNEKELGEAMDKLLTDRALREKLGWQALETVLARYTPGIVARKYSALFSGIAG